MIRFLAKKYIKNYSEVQNHEVRSAYTMLTGILGIGCNFLLFLLKVTVGFFIGSIAIIADAFNNLSDTMSSVVSIFSSKISRAEPDEEHPYGHGRVEYIATLIIAFLIVIVGVEVLKESVKQISSSSKPDFSVASIVIMLFALVVKIWMYRYNRYVGVLISSKVNLAVAQDSLNDILTTLAIIGSLLIGRYTDLPIDGLAGLTVGVYIVYSGYHIAKEMIVVLIGTAPDKETVDRVRSCVLTSAMVLHVNSIRLHDYGPGRTIGTVHVVMDADTALTDAHMEIDRIERVVMERLGVEIVIHVDPAAESHL